MRALVVRRFGGLDGVELASWPAPIPGPGDVLVRVRAASLNPIDAKIRAGAMRGFVKIEPPYVSGRDFAGTIEDRGDGVGDLALDTLVVGVADLARGSHAGLVAVPRANVSAAPAGIDPVGAASLGVAGLSAFIPLVEMANVQAGQRVLILGGAGGVGTLGVQIAAARGATVYATTRPPRERLLRDLGASGIVDHTTDAIERLAPDFDVMFDTVGGELQRRAAHALKPGGQVVELTAAPVDPAWQRQDLTYRRAAVRADGGRLDKLMALVAAGTLKPVVGAVHDFEDWATAFRALEAGAVPGKIVLDLGAD